MKLKSPDRGEKLEDLQKNRQRAARQYAASITVLGDNREGLHERGCQRSAQHQPLLNSVSGENLEDDDDHDHEQLERQRPARQSAAGARQQMTRSAHQPTASPSAAQGEPHARDTKTRRSWAHRQPDQYKASPESATRPSRCPPSAAQEDRDVSHVLRDVPLNTLLPASNLRQRCWPAPLG